jgi:biopolymer transport protein ExbB
MTLATIANIAPLIGFLGTVSGMIRAFTAIAEAGLGEPGVVAAGIGEALITTASGLIVAIPCFVAYNAFVARVNALALDIDLAGTRIANLVARGGEDEAA